LSTRTARRRHGAALVLAVLAALRIARAQQHGDEDVDALDLVRVVGVTPVTGTELPAAKLPYDVQSAEGAGVRCIAVRSGGYSESELVEAGAMLVVDAPEDLLDLDWEKYLAPVG